MCVCVWRACATPPPPWPQPPTPISTYLTLFISQCLHPPSSIARVPPHPLLPQHHVFGFPNLVRFSWGTSREFLDKAGACAVAWCVAAGHFGAGDTPPFLPPFLAFSLPPPDLLPPFPFEPSLTLPPCPPSPVSPPASQGMRGRGHGRQRAHHVLLRVSRREASAALHLLRQPQAQARAQQ